MARSSSLATNGVSQKGKLSAAQKHLPPADEGQALADAVDKSVELYSKYEQKRGSGNRGQHGAVVPILHVGSFVNDLMLVAGEAGMYGIIFKLIAMIKQRVATVKEVDAKALSLEKKSDQIMNCFEVMKARFASSDSHPEDQKSVLTQWEEQAVLLFAECAQVLGSIITKTSDKPLAGYKFWIDKAARPFTRCLTSPANLKDLDNCISKLGNFAADMLLEDRARTVNNDLPYLGEKPAVGTKFCESISKLTQFACENRSKISVLHISGPPGSGKSRLAKEILHKIYHSDRDHEAGGNHSKVELLQIDCSSSSGSHLEPVECQRKLLEQMADGRSAEGLSLKDVGYTKIRNVLGAWKYSEIAGRKRKIVMFFDNAPTHTSILNDVLPDDISKLLPPGSCVLVSMRGPDSGWEGSGVFEGIQRLFPSPRCRHKVHEVQKLQCLEAINLFEQYAKGPPDTKENSSSSSWSRIIQDLIDRCDGNPKLLILFGEFFRSQPRTQSFWKDILKKLEKMDDASAFSGEVLDGLWKEHASKASNDGAAEQQRKMYARFASKLSLVYQMKLGECQDAMSDISNLFDGWNWNTVEAIVGKDILRKLRDQKFVSSKLLFDNLKQDLGSVSHQVHSSSYFAAFMNKCGRRSLMQLKVVQANPELCDTARKITGDRHLFAMNTPLPKQLSDLQKGVSKNLRSLCLVDCAGKFQLRWLDRIQGLHHLILHNIQETEGVSVMPHKDLVYLHWGSTFNVRLPFEAENLPNLQTLVLTDFDFGTQPEIEIPSLLQSLSLFRCRNVQLVATSIFKLSLLKSLHLQECEGSCEFTVSDLVQPKSSTPYSLSFQNCADMEAIPAFVHRLQRLTDLRFIACPKLKGHELESRSFAKLKQRRCTIPCLKTVSFEDCKSLTCLPADLAPYVNSLTELEIRSCRIREVSPQIVLFQNMTKLTLASCPALQRLPQELGEVSNLRRLSLEESRALSALPSEIGKLQFLKDLNLDYCSSLQALPVEIENLSRLSSFSMRFCYGLDPKTEPYNLPDLGKLQELRYVNIAGLEPAHVHQKLIDSTNSIRHSSAENRFVLIKDLPKCDSRFNPFFGSAASPTTKEEDGRRYRSANN